jgi:hypothetical protein
MDDSPASLLEKLKNALGIVESLKRENTQIKDSFEQVTRVYLVAD